MKYFKIIFAALVLVVSTTLCRGEHPAGKFVSEIKLDKVSLADFTEMLRKRYQTNSALRDKREDVEKLPPITLELHNVPLWVVVKYACREAGVKYQFRDEMLYLGKDLQVAKTYYPADHKHEYSALDKYPNGTRAGIGRSAYFPVAYTAPRTIVSGNSVTVIPPKPIFKKFYSGFWYDSQPEQQEEQEKALIAKNKAKRHPYKIPRDFPLTKSKLFEIKFAADLQEVPLRQALNTLAKLSVKHDPEKQGVNFYIDKSVDEHNLLVDMKSNRMSLYRIIKYICQAAGLEYQVTPFVVEIYKKTDS
jgi:hypothetical protein